VINSSVLLVNLPYKITQVLIPLIKEELLGHFTLINDVNLSEFLPAQLNPNCIIVAYDESIKEEELASLNICEGIPVALITQNINFEMERTAKANNVSTIIDDCTHFIGFGCSFHFKVNLP